MSGIHAKGALAGLVVVFVIAAKATATYDPATGRFLSRDPGVGGPVQVTGSLSATKGRFVPGGASSQYLDGMNLYQYAEGMPARKTDPSGLFSVFDIGSEIGEVRITHFQPIKIDSFGHHERAWLFGVQWTPPRGGDWDMSCDCRPCQRVVWVQDYSMYHMIGGGGEWEKDWGPDEAEKFGLAWDCHKTGSTEATSYDQPGVTTTLGFLQKFYRINFEARTSAQCIAGPDKGRTYAVVHWGWWIEADDQPKEMYEPWIEGPQP